MLTKKQYVEINSVTTGGIDVILSTAKSLSEIHNWGFTENDLKYIEAELRKVHNQRRKETVVEEEVLIEELESQIEPGPDEESGQ